MSLDDRLARLDLRLLPQGPHVDEERLALIVTGAEPGDLEAAHLAGCDECAGLLVALGEGLELLADDRPGLDALMLSTAPPPRRAPRWVVVAGLLAAGAAAAAAGAIFLAPAPPELPKEAPAPRVTPPKVRPAPVPDLPAEAEPVLAPEPIELAPSAPAPVEVPEAAAEPPRPSVAPKAARTRARKVKPRPGVATPQAKKPDTSLSQKERAAVERGAVDGPSQGWGFLRLNTKPPAQVFIDGKARGWTPIYDLRLPEGAHDVRLVYPPESAKTAEERFRILIRPEKLWSTVRDNRR